jgi:hypothetical protein
MKYAVEMGLGAVIYILFRRDWFRQSKVDGGDSRAHRQHDDLISVLLFFKIRKVG